MHSWLCVRIVSFGLALPFESSEAGHTGETYLLREDSEMWGKDSFLLTTLAMFRCVKSNGLQLGRRGHFTSPY